MSDDSKVGVATTLTAVEQGQQLFEALIKRGVLIMGHPDVAGFFIHDAVLQDIIKLQGQIAQMEAERDQRGEEWAEMLFKVTADIQKGEAELKETKSKLASYEAAAPEVRALHAECQQVKARLHAFEQRYGQNGDRGEDIIQQFNAGIVAHHRELEAEVASLKSQLNAVTRRWKDEENTSGVLSEEKDEALRQLAKANAVLKEMEFNTTPKAKRSRKKQGLWTRKIGRGRALSQALTPGSMLVCGTPTARCGRQLCFTTQASSMG